MSETLLVMVWLVPLLLAGVAGHRHGRWLLPLAALPGALAALALPVGTTLSLPWLLLGSELGIDASGQVFLGFSAFLWLVTSLYIAGSRSALSASARLRVFVLLAMAGNLGLIVAQDLVSFYFAFTLMGLAAYGLIVPSATVRARRAGRVYLAWTLVGELLLLSGILMLAARGAGALSFEALHSVSRSGLVIPLLLAGFGIKLALPLLHWWLPRVYAVTPPALLALFSGVMIKAGVLGLLRFLPPGEATPAGWGSALVIIGAATLLFGVGVGLLQRRPRLLLGYSSISKMGVLITGLGVAVARPEAAPAIVAALLVYASHHALVKTALFLGIDLLECDGRRPWLVAGLAFLALVLAGAPLTSGALAKSVLGESVANTTPALVTLLTLSTVATTLLMVRFVLLVRTPRRRNAVSLPGVSVFAWSLLVAVIALWPWLLADAVRLSSSAVPVLLGLLLAPLVVPLAARVGLRWSAPRARRVPGAAHGLPWFDGERAASDSASLVRAVSERIAAWSQRLAPSLQAQRRPLRGALWLVLGGALLGALAAAN